MTARPQERDRETLLTQAITDAVVEYLGEGYRHLGPRIAKRVTVALRDAAPSAPPVEPRFDFAAHIERQREWSGRTFGPGNRTAGVVDHIRKELREIEEHPDDLSEWADVVILGLDGFWRAGATPEQIIVAIVAKQEKNEARTWPDWRTQPLDKAIEHDRTADDAHAALREGKGE